MDKGPKSSHVARSMQLALPTNIIRLLLTKPWQRCSKACKKQLISSMHSSLVSYRNRATKHSTSIQI